MSTELQGKKPALVLVTFMGAIAGPIMKRHKEGATGFDPKIDLGSALFATEKVVIEYALMRGREHCEKQDDFVDTVKAMAEWKVANHGFVREMVTQFIMNYVERTGEPDPWRSNDKAMGYLKVLLRYIHANVSSLEADVAIGLLTQKEQIGHHGHKDRAELEATA